MNVADSVCWLAKFPGFKINPMLAHVCADAIVRGDDGCGVQMQRGGGVLYRSAFAVALTEKGKSANK